VRYCAAWIALLFSLDTAIPAGATVTLEHAPPHRTRDTTLHSHHSVSFLIRMTVIFAFEKASV
jgi:hypothetical protein